MVGTRKKIRENSCKFVVKDKGFLCEIINNGTQNSQNSQKKSGVKIDMSVRSVSSVWDL